jgi:PAS domain S-box-containing protein
MPFSPVPVSSPAEAASRRRPVVVAFVATVLSLAFITAAKVATFNLIGAPTPFLLYFVPIIVAAWYGGWLFGVAVTAIAAALAMYFFLPPRSFDTTIPLLVFVGEGITLTAITARLRQEQGRARRAVQEAKAAVAQLEAVLGGVSDGITVQTARGELRYANDAAARLTGFANAREMMNASVKEIMSRFELRDSTGGPFDVAQLPGRLVLQGLPAPERLVRFRVLATNEERFSQLRATAVPLTDAHGREELVAVNVFHDVTEKRRQDEALRVSQEWLSITLNSIGDAVIATDAAGKVKFMNPLAERLTGWRVDEAEGRPLAEIFHIVNEETRTLVESPVDRVLREGKIVGLANHTVLVHRDGSEVAIDDSAAPIRAPGGELVGTVLVFRDVSDRRADEQRRAFLARATTELATSIDYEQTLATVVRLAVPTMADWCAIDILEAGRLRRLAVEHVNPDKIDVVYEIERRYPRDPAADNGAYHVIKTGKPVFLPEIPEAVLLAAAKDDEHLQLIRTLQLRSYLGVPLVDNGSVLGVLTLAMAESGRTFGPRDLELAAALADRAGLAVHHARLFTEASAARAEAERASRVKDEFLAMLGHELRNPLAPIVTALQLMKLRAPAVLERERAILERQVKHVVGLVDDLLDVSRITRGKIELSQEVVEVSEILAKALELTGPLLDERRHRVVTDVAPGLRLMGDPLRLAQVLTNLVSNAAKYTEPGGRIEIFASQENGAVVLRVRDSGVGLDAELLPRVFDLFVQGRQSLDRARGGLGLGLAIVRSVVEMHGGEVSAHSEGPGKGSEFRVRLPAHVSDAPAPTPPTPDPDNHGKPPLARVLVVDDNEDALELLAEALRLRGYETATAPDAVSAMERAVDTKPDIALLDIGLPLIDGYELARRLREIGGLERLKLVALTGYGQAADKARAQAAGFDEHMVKPISIDELQAILERLVPVDGKSDLAS